MRTGDARGARGFTYLALLWWVAISGVMLAALGTQWKLEATRQREAELVFRGEQIKEALASYQAGTPLGRPTSPALLSDLLDDRRTDPPRRHLRRLWPDPVTGRAWGLLRTKDGRVRGVYSDSGRHPLSAPEGIGTYREWLFDVPAAPAAPNESAASAASSPGPGKRPSPFASQDSLFRPLLPAPQAR